MEGNFVWATNPETGETELKPVVQLFRNETDEWVHVTVNGEEIVCTSEHPFYSPVKGWTAACRLRAGDILVLVNGEYVVVEQVQHELLESPVATYNFEVQDFHTNYVGKESVLVHNLCGTKSSRIDTYSNLKKQAKGTGNEVHHIIEKRFARAIDLGDPNQMGSVILTKSQHRVYTNAWRKALPYGKTYNADQIFNAAKSVYKDALDLLSYVTTILR